LDGGQTLLTWAHHGPAVLWNVATHQERLALEDVWGEPVVSPKGKALAFLAGRDL
jgi:hypothetical protein